MKCFVGLIVMVLMGLQANAQTFEGFEDLGNNYTCYHLDSNNVHCYVEDSDADLDLDNDGILDREYIFSTPEPNTDLDKRDLNKKGIIHSRKPGYKDNKSIKSDSLNDRQGADTIQIYPKGSRREL